LDNINRISIEANSSRQIKSGAVISYLAIAFKIIAGLIYTPWMVRQIGQADYGLFTLAVSVISFFALDFGLGLAVSRFLSYYRAKNDKEGAKRFLGIAYKLFITISVIIFIVLAVVYLLIENIYVKLTPDEISKLKVLFVIAGLFTVVSFSFRPLDGILIANERFVFCKLVGLLHKVFVVVLMVGALLLGYGLYALVIVNAFVGLAIIAGKFIYVKRATDTEIDFTGHDRTLLKDIFGFSVWITVIVVAQRFILNITPTILGAFAGSVQIALFSVGMTIEGYTWTISNAIGGLFLPKVARMTVKNSDMREIENLMIKVGRLQLLIVGLVIIGFAAMGKEFMVLWMGKNFLPSYYVAVLLIAPGIISWTQEIGNTTLVALNKIKYSAIASITTAFVSIILSIILSRTYGAIGAATGIFFGYIVGFIVAMNMVYYKVLKVDVFRFFRECHLKMLIPLLMAFAIGLFMQRFFPVENMCLFMVKAGIFCVIYFLLMWTLALNTFEKGLFADLFRKMYHILGRKH